MKEDVDRATFTRVALSIHFSYSLINFQLKENYLVAFYRFLPLSL